MKTCRVHHHVLKIVLLWCGFRLFRLLWRSSSLVFLAQFHCKFEAVRLAHGLVLCITAIFLHPTLIILISIFLRLLESHLHCLVLFAIVVVTAAKAILFITSTLGLFAHVLIDLSLLLFQHEFEGLALQILVAFDHDFFELVEIIYEKDLLNDLPLTLPGLCFFARLQKLLLVDADVL